MRKALFVLIAFLIIYPPLQADQGKEVTFRFSQQDQAARLVFESDETTIRNANVVSSPQTIRIDFPARIILKRERDLPFELIAQDRSVSVTVKDAGDARVSRLASPPRLVIDLKIGAKFASGSDARTPSPAPRGPADGAEKLFKVSSVVIDPGHGGYDYGIAHQELREKEVSLALAREVGSLCMKKGVKAALTRKADHAMTISDRIDFSNGRKPDLFMTIHASLSERFVISLPAVDDQQTQTPAGQYGLASRHRKHTEKAEMIAKAIGESLKSEFKNEVIIRKLPLSVLLSLDSPGILIEYPALRTSSYDQKYRDRVSAAIARGILPREQ